LKIEDLLEDRAKSHGLFSEVADTAQSLKIIIHQADHLGSLHLEALDLIATKIARICHGDPDDKDHWLDIEGYARLAATKDDEDD
tara:strand:+ start:711 stop:965 length:255 start_codon:yes stop_codon:yes gene_type:complete